MRKSKRRTVNSFLDLEAKFFGNSELADVVEGIKEIFQQVYPKDPKDDRDYCKEFITTMYLQSSGDFLDYSLTRNRLLADLAKNAAMKQKNNLENTNISRQQSNSKRDVQMAQEYQRKKSSSQLSVTALKANIGKKHDLKRTAAIEAINRGLEIIRSGEG
jgi:hypothetical protein